MARTEWLIALLCYWLGAIDVREQYPLWPWPHPHPLKAIFATYIKVPSSVGLLEVAKDAGIDHGEFIGTKVPYVATTDLLVTVQGIDGPRLAAIPVKAEKKLLESEPADAVRRRLELERRYHTALGNHVAIATEELVPDVLAGQLIWLSSAAYLPTPLDNPIRTIDFANTFNEVAERTSVTRGIEVATKKCRLSAAEGNYLFRHVVWTRLVDLDITRDIEMSYPPRRGTERIVSVLRSRLFGELA